MAQQTEQQPLHFSEQYPDLYARLDHLDQGCAQFGPLDRKTQLLIKVAMAASCYFQNTVQAFTAQCLDAGITAEEIEHAIMTVMPMIGYPKAVAALHWAHSVSGQTPFK